MAVELLRFADAWTDIFAMDVFDIVARKFPHTVIVLDGELRYAGHVFTTADEAWGEECLMQGIRRSVTSLVNEFCAVKRMQDKIAPIMSCTEKEAIGCGLAKMANGQALAKNGIQTRRGRHEAFIV